ncbi:MAG: glycosyltransferase family 39 protein [Flavobacteriales bacterium]|nr:glycosyltransferase family 39 protein [Flavobacteriales bacterium]
MGWRHHIARYGERWFPGEPWVRWTFLALFAVGAVLRSWHLTSLPFTHDELSALVRIYPTLGETIQRGVIELDTHPPGVQVFEWLWTRLFGMSSFAVKLPFVLMSLAALFLVYRSALAWTSAATALLSTALLATLQFSVLYGQIARPYAAGLFTTALLADQLTRFLAFGGRRYLVGLATGAVLSAYTHHFTLMLAIIMVATGLVLVKAEQRKGYLAVCAIAVLAYLPNIPIFLKQLSLGGLSGWLVVPGPYWLVEHVQWLVQYSVPLGVFLAALIALSLFGSSRVPSDAGPARWFLPLWGLMPLFVGYAYSTWKSPVLQYSMLLFSFPYVLIALFAGLRVMTRQLTIILCAVTVVLVTTSLIFDRHHYDVFYTSRYEAMFDKAEETILAQGYDRTLVLFDAPHPQLEFYRKQRGVRSRFVHFEVRGMSAGALDSLIEAVEPAVVVLGISNGAAQEDAARVQAHLPFLWERTDHVEGQVLVFGTEHRDPLVRDRTLLAEARPGVYPLGPWVVNEHLPMERDTTGKPWWRFEEHQFGVECSLPIPTAPANEGDAYEVVAEVDARKPNTDFAIVLEFICNGQSVLYRNSGSGSFSRTGTTTLVVAASPSWVLHPPCEIMLKAYVFDPHKSGVRLGRVAVYRRQMNPVQNALLAPVYDLGYRTN